jgi:hypothetical protein
MENNKQNIFIAVIFVILIIGGIVFYWQQKSINQLKALEASRLASPQSQETPGKIFKGINQEQGSTVDVVKKEIDNQQQNVNFIAGKVLQISGDTLKVEADISDWNKMKEIASSPELSQQYQNKMAPTIKKTYSVSVTGETKFLSNKFSDIKVGDTILVNAKELVYQTDNLTALGINSPFQVQLPSEIQP